jgi:hypothetical protein
MCPRGVTCLPANNNVITHFHGNVVIFILYQQCNSTVEIVQSDT